MSKRRCPECRRWHNTHRSGAWCVPCHNYANGLPYRPTTHRPEVVKQFALDLADFDHMTSGGDIDYKTWRRVCSWRFDPNNTEDSIRRAFERWKRRVLKMGLPYLLVDSATGDTHPPGSRGTRRTGYWTQHGDGDQRGEHACDVRVDWALARRFVKHVLGN